MPTVQYKLHTDSLNCRIREFMVGVKAIYWRVTRPPLEKVVKFWSFILVKTEPGRQKSQCQRISMIYARIDTNPVFGFLVFIVWFQYFAIFVFLLMVMYCQPYKIERIDLFYYELLSIHWSNESFFKLKYTKYQRLII